MTDQLQPHCPRCRERHLPGIVCWTLAPRLRAALKAIVIGASDVCCHCHQPGSDTLEHLTPRSLGGTHDLANLAPAHRDCNSRRGVKPLTSRTLVPASRDW